MSVTESESTLESLFLKYISLGFSEKEAEKKAREELSRKGDPMAKGGIVEKRVKFAKPSNFKGTF